MCGARRDSPTGIPRQETHRKSPGLLWPEPAAGGSLQLEEAISSVYPEGSVLGAPQIKLTKDRLTGEKESDEKLQNG